MKGERRLTIWRPASRPRRALARGFLAFWALSVWSACTTTDSEGEDSPEETLPASEPPASEPPASEPPATEVPDTVPPETQPPATETPAELTPSPTPEEVFVLNRPSRSATIALSNDDTRIVMVNPEDDTISIFNAADLDLVATITTGDEPSSVVIHPDGTHAFVANRADGTVVKITGIDSPEPYLVDIVEVGSEPTGLALSPTGTLLFVAEYAEGRISVFDTRTMAEDHIFLEPKHPRALAVTNDGDEDENDEVLIAPEFFGEPVAGGEATDTGRNGLVRFYDLDTYASSTAVRFAPIDSGFFPDGSPDGTPTVMTSPNQLYSVAVHGDRIYVTSISASPKGPVKFNTNVQPVVYVGDLNDRTEDVTSGAGTTNLARKVADALSSGNTRFFLADIVDIDFKPTTDGSNLAYVLSRGADVVQRVVYTNTSVTLGSTFNTQIDVGTAPSGESEGCKTPTGIVTSFGGSFAYVNCWANRRLGVIDLSVQALKTTVESAASPEGDAASVADGLRFFFTARGRWSKESWSGCGSCHPDGLSDNITWSFAAGPRQTTSLDGTYSHGSSAQKQRILNWTGIFDEMHDFERNTRGTSGGLGAITTSSTGACGDLTQEQAVTLPGNMNQPLKEVQDTTAGVCTHDWDDIDAFVKTIRPPRSLKTLDLASVARGAVLFSEPDALENNAGCVRCHGGVGWTASRRYWAPSTANNNALHTEAFEIPGSFPDTWNYNTVQIQTQPAISDTSTGPAEASAIAPDEVSCVLRNIGTFGIPGDTTGTNSLEVKVDGTSRAQGRGGYNIPSLYGMSLGAPYLHHGQVASLEDLFSDSKWEGHLKAGNAVLSLTDQQKQDLINFVLSIDATTEEQALPAAFDACPDSF